MQTYNSYSKLYNLWLLLVFLFFITACTSQQNLVEKQKLAYTIQFGVNNGGITENKDIVKTNDVAVDAFSGATNKNKIGLNLGFHLNLPFRKNSVETGIDLMYNNHIFDYKDVVNNYYGNRGIDINQIMLPLTYNFGFFKKNNPNGAFQLKVGGLVQCNILNVSKTGVLPDYDYNNFSGGVTFGIKIIPVQFQNNARLGFYMDVYRGSQIYKDLYNQSNFEMPGSSFIKAGILYQF